MYRSQSLLALTSLRTGVRTSDFRAGQELQVQTDSDMDSSAASVDDLGCYEYRRKQGRLAQHSPRTPMMISTTSSSMVAANVQSVPMKAES